MRGVPFNQALLAASVGQKKVQAKEYLPEGYLAVVDQGQELIAGYTNEMSKQCTEPGPLIIFGDHTRTVKYVDFPFAVGADGVKLFRAREGFDPEFLYLFLKSAQLPNDGYGRHAKHLQKLQIPAYSITDQRLIAARLKEQLAAGETARMAVEAQQAEVVNLANAYIRASLQKGSIRRFRLGDLADEIKKGVGADWERFPVLGATRAGLAPAKEPVGKSPERYKPVQPGTVFYNPMRILIGSIAMIDADDAPGITSPDYVALKTREGVLHYRWFYYWLRSPLGERYIASLARGAVRERMLFNRLAEGEIEIPSWDVQCSTAAALAELRPLRATLQKRLAEIGSLPPKILDAVFS